MRQTLLSLCVVLCLASGLASAPAAHAETRQQAVSKALAADGNRGRVLSVRREKSGDREVWAVKVMTDGRVRVHRMPAD